MNGTRVVQTKPLGPGTVDPSWRIVAIADYDGDGKPDLIWQNTAGSLAVTYLSNLAVKQTSPIAFPFPIPPGWFVAGPK